MYEYAMELLRVVDGDTLEAKVDLGFRVYEEMELRLLGLNTPEMRTPEGKDARRWVDGWFIVHVGPHLVRTVKSLHQDKKEKYGRYLATVFAADGACLNEDLLAAGIAQPYNP